MLLLIKLTYNSASATGICDVDEDGAEQHGVT